MASRERYFKREKQKDKACKGTVSGTVGRACVE